MIDVPSVVGVAVARRRECDRVANSITTPQSRVVAWDECVFLPSPYFQIVHEGRPFLARGRRNGLLPTSARGGTLQV